MSYPHWLLTIAAMLVLARFMRPIRGDKSGDRSDWVVLFLLLGASYIVCDSLLQRIGL